MSRVLVLGAAGAVGRACSYFLIKSNAFDEIIPHIKELICFLDG